MQYSAFQKSDRSLVEALFRDTFSDSEGESEGEAIGKLAADLIETTQAGDLFGYVAKAQDRILGAIFFSRITFGIPLDAFILSPVAVCTSHQRSGVGQQLIRYGIRCMKELGVELLITYGDPKYYSKFGFQPLTEDIIKAPLKLSQPIGWQGMSLSGEAIQPIAEKPRCVSALNHQHYW